MDQICLGKLRKHASLFFSSSLFVFQGTIIFENEEWQNFLYAQLGEVVRRPDKARSTHVIRPLHKTP